MSLETKKLLKNFSERANWSVPGNPSDMERFWDFVISAYRKSETNISLDEFLDVISSQTKNKEGVRDIKTKKRELASKMFMFSKCDDGIRLLCKFEGK